MAPTRMNSLSISVIVSLLVFAIFSVRHTSTASFPNPPQMPSHNAPPEDWALFWKLLHNYYAIIARPRFGKRFDPISSEQEHEPVVSFLDRDSATSSSRNFNYMLSDIDHKANGRRIDPDEQLFTIMYSNPRRRQRQRGRR